MSARERHGVLERGMVCSRGAWCAPLSHSTGHGVPAACRSSKPWRGCTRRGSGGERGEVRRLAAGAHPGGEMAETRATVFNVHVPVFIDYIWTGLRDPRDRGARARRARPPPCLKVVEKRETRWRVQVRGLSFRRTPP